MRYNLFDGGDGLAYPWNTTQSSFSGGYVPLPAEHHKRRSITLERHIDTASREWRGNYAGLQGQADKPLAIEDGDEFSSHLIGAGWLMHRVAVHVKRAGVGTITPKIVLDDGTEHDVVDGDGAALEIDLAETGHHLGFFVNPGFGMTEILADSGYVLWTYAGEETDPDEGTTSVLDGCFGIYVSLTDYHDEHDCECAPMPCETEFPDPECVVQRSPAGGGSGGGQAAQQQSAPVKTQSKTQKATAKTQKATAKTQPKQSGGDAAGTGDQDAT